jgi:hypothetical protein
LAEVGSAENPIQATLVREGHEKEIQKIIAKQRNMQIKLEDAQRVGHYDLCQVREIIESSRGPTIATQVQRKVETLKLTYKLGGDARRIFRQLNTGSQTIFAISLWTGDRQSIRNEFAFACTPGKEDQCEDLIEIITKDLIKLRDTTHMEFPHPVKMNECILSSVDVEITFVIVPDGAMMFGMSDKSCPSGPSANHPCPQCGPSTVRALKGKNKRSNIGFLCVLCTFPNDATLGDILVHYILL